MGSAGFNGPQNHRAGAPANSPWNELPRGTGFYHVGRVWGMVSGRMHRDAGYIGATQER